MCPLGWGELNIINTTFSILRQAGEMRAASSESRHVRGAALGKVNTSRGPALPYHPTTLIVRTITIIIGALAAERFIRVRSRSNLGDHGAPPWGKKGKQHVCAHTSFTLSPNPPLCPILFHRVRPCSGRGVDTFPGRHHASRLVSTNSPISPTSTYLIKKKADRHGSEMTTCMGVS